MVKEIIENNHICAIVRNKNDLYLNAEITEAKQKFLPIPKIINLN